MKSQHLALKHAVFRRAETTATAATVKPVLPTIVKATSKATSAAASKTSAAATSKTSVATSASATSASSTASATSTSTSAPATSSSSSSLATSSSTAILPNTTLDRGLSSSSSSSSLSSTSHTSSAIDSAHTNTSDKSAAGNGSDKSSQTSGLATGGIIGIIAASVGGVILIILAVGFVLRRIRKKRKSSKFASEFDADKFRRSAVLLDEKDQGGLRPRPPTIIERKNKKPATPPVSTLPPPPSMAYPYSDQVSIVASAPPSVYGGNGSDHGHGMQQQQYPQYGSGGPQYGALPPPAAPQPSQGSIYNGVQGAYGVPPPGAYGAQYEQAGYGAPPIPGTYGPGAYASYSAGPVDPRYPHQYSPHQRQQFQLQQQGQGYPQQQQQQVFQHPQQPQHPGQYGQQMNQGYNSSQAFSAQGQPTRMDSMLSNPSLPNPFARSPVPSLVPQAPSPPSSVSSSGITEKHALHLATTIDDDNASASGSTSLRRQPTQSSGAPPAYDAAEEDAAKWAARRDQKVKPVELKPPASPGAAEASSSAVAPSSTTRPNANAERPVSGAYSLYNQDDVYGGM